MSELISNFVPMKEKKTVLLDICEITNPASGFGQIARNYAHWYGHASDPDIHFQLMTNPSQMAQYKDSDSIHLWHSTNQQQLKRRHSRNSKFIITIHDLNYLTEKGLLSRLKHNYQLQKAINQASAITAISHYVARQIESNFDMKGKKVRVIYNGVENITQEPESQPAFVTGRPFFFAIGQIRKKKNFHLLADMMQHLPDYDLYICGDDHFDFSKVVRQHISQLPTANAMLAGKITAEERVWLYRHCSAFLFPSIGEGFGLPVIEAMQFGKPVFISNATCLPEICHGHACIWPTLKPDEMARVVAESLPKFTETMANDCISHAQKFSYQTHIQSYISLYRELLLNE